jgi:hypothetical protein
MTKIAGNSLSVNILGGLSILAAPVRLDGEAKPLFQPAQETTMQYLLLIYNNERNWTELPEADVGALMGDYQSFTQSIAKSGHYKGGNALQPTNTATTVRVRNGKRTATDGPFAETREQLGGYYLIDAKDLDEAIGIAARIPGALTGAIEVRPVMQTPAPVPA